MDFEINLSKLPSFQEVYYEGYVEFQGKNHYFWLVHPHHNDENGNPYEIEIKWWFYRVPKEVRNLMPKIIEGFKERHRL